MHRGYYNHRSNVYLCEFLAMDDRLVLNTEAKTNLKRIRQHQSHRTFTVGPSTGVEPTGTETRSGHERIQAFKKSPLPGVWMCTAPEIYGLCQAPILGGFLAHIFRTPEIRVPGLRSPIARLYGGRDDAWETTCLKFSWQSFLIIMTRIF